MTLRRTKVTAIIAFCLMALAALWAARDRKPQPEKITIGVAVQPVSAPVYIAYEKGFFKQEGLQVTMRNYWVGKDALQAVMDEKAQFCTVAETPIMFAGLKHEPIAVVATIADSRRYMKMIARKDRGIAGPGELRGKRIAVSLGTNAQYYLDVYLMFFGVPRSSVRVVPLAPEKIADALAQGGIDAAVSWEPHLERQQNMLGVNGLVLENEIIYELYWNIAARQDYAATHADAVKKLLRALLRAQQYMEQHPQDAHDITARYVGVSQFDLADFNFDVRLPQSLILSLEEQARWAVRSGLAGADEVPNFLRLVYTSGLESVAPDAVNLPVKR